MLSEDVKKREKEGREDSQKGMDGVFKISKWLRVAESKNMYKDLKGDKVAI